MRAFAREGARHRAAHGAGGAVDHRDLAGQQTRAVAWRVASVAAASLLQRHGRGRAGGEKFATGRGFHGRHMQQETGGV